MGTARDFAHGDFGDIGPNLRDTAFGKKGRSESTSYEVPGVLSRERGGEFAEQAGALAGQPINQNLQALLEQNLMNRPNSPYGSSLQSRLLSPDAGPYQGALQRELTGPAQFGGLSESENNLVNQAYSGRQAQFNALGIGSSPLAQSAIAAAGAPTLVGLRQQRIQDLLSGQGQFQQQQQNQTQNLLTGQGQFGTQQNEFLQNLLQSLQQGSAQRGQTLSSYLDLARLGQPQLGNRSNQVGGQPGIFSQIDPNKAFDQAMAL